MIIRLVTIAALSAALLGCSPDKPVDTVKNAILPLDKTVTLGGALSHYRYCDEKSASWREDTTKKGAREVIFSCTLTDAGEAFGELYANSLVGMVSGGLAGLAGGNFFMLPEEAPEPAEAERLLDGLLDKLQAGDEVREAVHRSVDPYKVNGASVEFHFAMDKTDARRFEPKTALLHLEWKDRNSTVELQMPAALSAVYADRSILSEAARDNAFEDIVREAWDAAKPAANPALQEQKL